MGRSGPRYCRHKRRLDKDHSLTLVARNEAVAVGRSRDRRERMPGQIGSLTGRIGPVA
jgi:hypothetical protein